MPKGKGTYRNPGRPSIQAKKQANRRKNMKKGGK